MTVTKRKIHPAAAWFCLLLLAYLSLIPRSLEVRTGMPGELEHLVAYFGTAVLFTTSYAWSPWVIVTGLASYGGFLEILQTFSPGRTVSALDALASGTGVVLGVAAAVYFFRKALGRHRRDAGGIGGP